MLKKPSLFCGLVRKSANLMPKGSQIVIKEKHFFGTLFIQVSMKVPVAVMSFSKFANNTVLLVVFAA